MQDHLESYNDTEEKKMSLVVFPEFAEHVARMVRALMDGHVLLLGPSGCGKRSVTRLAAYLRGYRCTFKAEVNRVFDSRQLDINVKRN